MNLLGSKLRTKLLTHTFTHPDEQFYVRELADLLEVDPGNLSRELRRLEEDGLLTATLKGKVKFFSLNRDYPLYDEFKKIIFKTSGIRGSLAGLVREFDEIIFACLYGSYAAGREKGTSDIDLILVVQSHPARLTRRIRELESQVNREIHFTFYTPQEFSKKRKEQGGFLNLTLKGKIIILKGDLYGAEINQ